MAKLVTGKVDFRAKEIVRDKEGHYTKIKGPINKEDILLLNTPKHRVAKYMN